MDFETGMDGEDESETGTCPKCGYESAQVHSAPFRFQGEDPSVMMVAMIPVTDCPICNEQTPMRDPELCKKEALEIQRQVQNRMMEEALKGDSFIKNFYRRNAASLFSAGVLIGYGLLKAADCLKGIGKPAFWIDLGFGVFWGLFGGYMAFSAFRRLNCFNKALTIFSFRLEDKSKPKPTSENTK